MKKRPKYNQNSVIRGALRRAFARSPIVQEKMAESRREEPRYNKDGGRAKRNWVKRQCEVCLNWVGSTCIAVDHKEPVISVDDGFQDWNIFVARLWCDKNNLQRICDECHDKKTAIERTTRLIRQYTEELNELSAEVDALLSKPNSIHCKELKKKLAKYIAKKKSADLRPIVERAMALRKKII